MTAPNGLYGVHVLHADNVDDRLWIKTHEDGMHVIFGDGEPYATTDELRSIFTKGLALCDQLDAAEGKTPTDPTTEFLYRTEDMHGRVLAEGDRSDEWRVTSLEVKHGRIILHTAGGHYVSQSTTHPVEVVR